ncbi:hypothetical protein GCM10027400_27700 [Pseudoxanthomonas daejeonensis]
MRGTDQQSLATLQELAGRPVQAPAGMWAHIQPGAHDIALAMDDQGLGIVAQPRFGLDQRPIGQPVKTEQWFNI